MSTVYLFEGTDILSWLSAGTDVEPATVERGLALLRGRADRLDATAPPIGLPPVHAVRNALGGAARLHLRLLFRREPRPRRSSTRRWHASRGPSR